MKSSSLLRMIVVTASVLYLGTVLGIGIACQLLSACYWVNFAFMALIAVSMLVATLFRPKRNDRAFFPFTLQYVKSTVTYVVCAAAASLSMMFIKGLPWFVPLLVHAVALAVFIIYVASSSFGLAHIKEVHDQQTAQVEYLILLETKLCEARDTCEDATNRATLERLIRTVQNSSYKSYPEARAIELELLNKADELLTLDGQDQADALKQIHVLLNKRSNTISMIRR